MLDDRLEAVAAFVGSGASVADIGTDHGYLAMELKRRDGSRRVIAADKNGGPCRAARKTLGENGMEQAVEVRQGDGLAALAAGEVDTVCIAGMGGKLIADILAARPEVFDRLECAVLQPQNAFVVLRGWLYEHGWHIADEALAKVDGRVYQIIRAVPGRVAMPPRKELLIGPVLLQKRPELFREHVENNLEALAKVLTGMRKGSSPDRQRLQELEKDMEELEAMLG